MAADPAIVYDVLIVGAGPAGSTLARMLSGTGKRVLLLNGQTPGKAKVCGGLLAPDAQKVLAAFDLTLPKRVLVDPQIFSVKTIDAEADLVRYYSRFYINADRGKFDDWLRSLVPPDVEIAAGRCTALERNADGTFTAAQHLAGGGPVTLRAKCVVGADGALRAGKVLPMTIIHDHRATDAADFVPMLERMDAIFAAPEVLRDML